MRENGSVRTGGTILPHPGPLPLGEGIPILPDLAPTLILAGLAVLVLPVLSPRWAPGRVAVMGLAVVLMLRYLVWRLAETLPPLALDPAALWMWGLAVVETAALANAILTALFLMRRRDRRAQADAAEAALAQWPALPAVDVVIPTYNEPLEVVERAIVGALGLDWPQVRVWVLDDGRRPWLAEYCAAKGAAYVTRADNAHGKAGNLNAWLAATAGRASPFMLVLDADFVPQRHFLRRVIGLFADPAVGLVQTPQSFFNPDPIQMNLLCGPALADEQRFFYHHFQPCLDAWGAAFCCGTSFVVRRDRLDAVGGIPTDTVTEDMMTTYALAAHGWRTLYLDEPLSAGLAAEGLAEFVGQRARWCLGTVQALRAGFSPFRHPRIGWAHRLCFVNAQLFWLASFPLMLMATVGPALSLWTGVPAFLAEPGDFFAHYGPRFVAEAAAMVWASRGAVVPVLGGLAPLISAPKVVAAAIRALARPRGQAFKVTKKGGTRPTVVVHGGMAGWIGLVMAVTAAGLLANCLPELGLHGDEGLTMGWGAYALGMLFLALLVCIEVPRRRGHERLFFAEPGTLRWDGGSAAVGIVEMSLTGAGIDAAAAPEAGAVTLEVEGVGPLAAQVVRNRGGRLSLCFTDLGEARDALLRKLYTTPAVLPRDDLDAFRAVRCAMRRGFASAD